MFNILFISRKKGEPASFETDLPQYGFSLSSISYDDIEMDELPPHTPDMVIIEVSGSLPTSKSLNLITRLKKKTALPVLAIADKNKMDIMITLNKIDDFVVFPYDKDELILRIKRLLQKVKNIDSSDILKCDGLTIDIVKYEVTLENRVIELTFKEYELLLYLASNKGRVFTREALLNKVWGFDYFGGDRTVDVHIRRLRSKIEDSDHTFIETVRNIGYRFIKNTEK
ncbi:MAG: response regulator transcription factor [Dehalococcoidales bacterium]|nr:response regulator transcription factor [Dehalococcoidales bacterium]